MINARVGYWPGRVSGIPTDFAGADDIITNLAKKRESGIEVIKRTPQSLIITITQKLP